jgi:hypothetical protein
VELIFPAEDAGAGTVFFGGFLVAQFHADTGEGGVEVDILLVEGDGLVPGLKGFGVAALGEEDFGEGVPGGVGPRILLDGGPELGEGGVGVPHGEIEGGLIDEGLDGFGHIAVAVDLLLQVEKGPLSLPGMIRFPKRPSPVKQVNAFCEVRNSPIHGKGVFASRFIRKGTRILEYVGERIDKEESNRRGLVLFEQSQKTGGAAVYIFDLNDEFDLDGNKDYNDARLVNHSCDPNCEMVNEDDRLFLYSLRDIRPEEELCFDYGYDIEHFMDHPCRCGAPNCVGYIVARSQWGQLRRRLKKGAKKQGAGA